MIDSEIGDLIRMQVIPAVSILMENIPLSFPSHVSKDLFEFDQVDARDVAKSDQYCEILRVK